MRYVAMDFETGNGSYTSACSIGLSYYEDHKLVGSESFLIRPPDEVGKFHWYNVKIHGIKRSMVKDAPPFDQVWEKIRERVEGSVVVCHNAGFDTEVLCRCLEFYHVPLPSCRYICTVEVSKKVWPMLENHKLNTVAEALGIALNHHDAASDAHACGEILQCAMRKLDCSDACALAEKLGMQLGTITPEGRRSGAAAKQLARKRKSEQPQSGEGHKAAAKNTEKRGKNK